MGTWRLLDRFISLLSTVGAVLAVIALSITAVSIIWEVILRGVFGSPTIWAIEVATYGVTVSAFLGAAYVLRRGGHLEIDLLTSLLSSRGRFYVGLLTDLVALVVCGLVAYYGLRFVHVSWLIGSVSVSELRVPLWIPQLSVPIGFCILTLEFAARLLVRLGYVERNLRAPDGSTVPFA